MDEMVGCYLDAILPGLKKNVVLFGHSLGGTVAFEVAKKIEKQQKIKGVIVSAASAPGSKTSLTVHSSMDDESLLGKTAELGGMQSQLLKDRGFVKMFLESYRADLKTLENYRERGAAEDPLNTPVLVFYADGDTIPVSDIGGWKKYLKYFKFISFKGDHFYLFEDKNRSMIFNYIEKLFKMT